MKISLGISLLLFCTSCTTKESSTLEIGRAFYPTEIGKGIVYDVDSIAYNGFNNDTIQFRFQRKITPTEIFIDNAGDSTYKIEQVKRINNTENWQIEKIWTLNKRSGRIEHTINNQRFIALAFPIKESTNWDPNAFNLLGKESYTYANLGQTFEAFDNTVTLVQSENVNVIEDLHAFEQYAKNIGLIYKEQFNVRKIIENGLVKTPFELDGYEVRMQFNSIE